MTENASLKFVPRRGRPSAKQVAAIKHTILSTARRLFLEDGYEQTPMEGVAAEAGVSKGTLYSRYASKESLFEAVVQASIAEWSADAGEDDHLLGDDLAARLHHHARTIAHSQFIPEVRAFQRLLFANGDRFPSLAKVMYENGYLYIVRILQGDIEAAAQRDGIPVRDAVGVARHLVSAITGYHLQETGHHDLSLAETEAFAARAVDLLMMARAIW